MSPLGDLARQDEYDVPLEQSTGVGWANRIAEKLPETWPARLAQDAIGAILAPGRALASREPITSEQMIKPAADLGGLVMGGSYAAPAIKDATGMGIRAYHSSPHDFNRFELSKIGTGEGNQSYGHGLYFAENPAVSDRGGMYWRQFVTKFKDPERTAARYLQGSGFDRENAIQSLRRRIAVDEARVAEQNLTGDALATHNKYNAKQKAILAKLESGDPVGPRTYQVDINADPAHLLHWDKPLQEQPHVVQAMPELLDFARQEAHTRARDAMRPERAEQLWSMVKDPLQAPGSFGVEPSLWNKGQSAELSALMQSRGIPGLKYFDEASRGMPSLRGTPASDVQTSNYVVFDPSRIDILKKYGLAGATAGTLGSLAAQDRYEGQ